LTVKAYDYLGGYSGAPPAGASQFELTGPAPAGAEPVMAAWYVAAPPPGDAPPVIEVENVEVVP
jgi:hypothetical protein